MEKTMDLRQAQVRWTIRKELRPAEWPVNPKAKSSAASVSPVRRPLRKSITGDLNPEGILQS
jgi:hypothetical protein